MFTKNWYKCIAGNMLYNYDSTYINFKNINGADKKLRASNYDVFRLGYNTTSGYTIPSLYSLAKSLTSNSGVVLGSGTTPPTMDDYTLSGEVFTNFTFTADVKKEIDEDGVTFTANYTITNTGDSDFTIGEIGLLSTLSESTGSGYAENKGLLERTVLDAPVTIPSGGIGQLTYTVRVNYPTA
jgi:hypothetical protein